MEDFCFLRLNAHSCADAINYKSKQAARKAERELRLCKKCRDASKKDVKYTRECPQCSRVLIYKLKYEKKRADERQSVCRDCSNKNKRTEFYSGKSRKCPSCNTVLSYSTTYACTRANKNNDLCKSCSLKGTKPSLKCIEASIKLRKGKNKRFQ